MTPREAHEKARQRGHRMLKYGLNPYWPGLLTAHCRRCGATLLENRDGSWSGNTLRRACASILKSKRARSLVRDSR